MYTRFDTDLMKEAHNTTLPLGMEHANITAILLLFPQPGNCGMPSPWGILPSRALKAWLPFDVSEGFAQDHKKAFELLRRARAWDTTAV